MRDQTQHDRGRALVDLVAVHLPQDFEVTGDANAWPLVGAGLASRMTSTLESILALLPSMREVDAAILLRSLYEHAVHFAWLASEPSAARIEEWRKHDLTMRLKADTDARDHGVPLLSDEARGDLEAQIRDMAGNDLVLTNLAASADTHWTGKLPGMDGQGGSSPSGGSTRFSTATTAGWLTRPIVA